MATNGKASHAQIWDDTALVDSWDAAMSEYKKYHSIKARGQSINDVVKETKMKDADVSREDAQDVYEQQTEEQPVNDLRAKMEATEETADFPVTSTQKQAPVAKQGPEPDLSNRSPALPQHLIGQVHDEGLKNLLMSWYYAGYYTGLYEGQQKAKGGEIAKHEA